jgi:hypothetical protein
MPLSGSGGALSPFRSAMSINPGKQGARKRCQPGLLKANADILLSPQLWNDTNHLQRDKSPVSNLGSNLASDLASCAACLDLFTGPHLGPPAPWLSSRISEPICGSTYNYDNAAKANI